ncbi:LAME_0H11232g1_1 [Lachancea meyersii CBS 8951]|uniref:EKC/KEOPS complex subunit CGI121 n=1 Tax=Lachancea meyersii CBS 8951 TaxID=1266667 RepID=A0A1G4KG26_9SACH|nr:LAME_0H11232g1_1 [Lachancea meyersii CBS 8951]
MLRHSIPQFDSFEIHASLFTDVQNTEDLRAQVATMPFAMIDASTICSLEQLFCAVYKALVECKYNRLRTKTLNSECILSLSPTSNIAEAFKRFGIKEDSKNIVCLAVTNKSESPFSETVFKEQVKGNEIELSDENLSTTLNRETIKKVRNINCKCIG